MCCSFDLEFECCSDNTTELFGVYQSDWDSSQLISLWTTRELADTECEIRNNTKTCSECSWNVKEITVSDTSEQARLLVR